MFLQTHLIRFLLGKKQLNQLKTFLDKSGTVKEGLGSSRSDAAVRNVRAKREAEDAGTFCSLYCAIPHLFIFTAQ